jgi:hypothetical protein
MGQSIPTPESVLGFRVGDDFKLASYDESIRYFKALDAATDRLQLVEVGKTSAGMPMYVALISTPENLRNVEQHRALAQQLAHPEGLTDDEARALARDGKAIVAIDGGLHASETAHAQHTIQLAYDLVTEKDGDAARMILDNLVLVLWPSINPDGQNMIVEWYRANLGTPYETSRLPQLYQKYIGHDNNRDGYGLNMVESRVAVRTVRHWEPQVIYSHHMTGPFPATIWLPPYADPISPYVHPLMNRMMSMMGMAAAEALEQKGQVGATHMGTGYDAWYPGYIDYMNAFHNVVIMFSETGLHGSATPQFYTVNDFPQGSRDLRPGTLHSSLWKGGWWRLRNSVDYMLTSSTAVLELAAKYREDILYNRYQAGRDAIATYADGPPYAYFIPQQQRDPVAAVELLRRLAFQDIEVRQLSTAVTFEGQTYPAGTWVVPMDRANANLTHQLLSVQDYPDIRQYPEGPPDQPYDIAGWTLPYQMDVHVVAAGSPLSEEIRRATRPVTGEVVSPNTEADAASFDMLPGPGFNTNAVAAGIVPLPGRATGSGSGLYVDMVQNNGFKAINRAWREGGRVGFVAGGLGTEGNAGSGGGYVISGLSAAGVNALVADYALQAERTSATGTPLPQPRIGLYRPWAASMDEGWTRFLLENFGFEFRNLYNADIRAGDLRTGLDVLILPDMSPRQILNGSAPGTVPPRYAGGLGREGSRALEEFVRRGGTLVTLNSSSLFAIEALHLPVKDVVGDLERTEFFLSGSIVEMTADPSHPVMTGMPERAKVMSAGSPVFTVTEEFEGSVLAKYQTAGSPLLSGYLLGEKYLNGFATALDVRHGDGHVILLGMRPQWRGQPYGTFRILFNAALYSRQMAATVSVNGGFWEAPAAKDDAKKDNPE